MENRIVELFSKYLNRTILAEEFEELKEWISNSDENRAEFENVVSGYKSSMAAEAITQFAEKRSDHSPKRRLILIRSIAAAVMVGFIVGTTLLLKNNNNNSKVVAEVNQQNPVRENILLKSVDNRLVVTEGGRDIEVNKVAGEGIKVSESSLDYSELLQNEQLKGVKSIPSSIRIPKGKQFQLILSDGTKIWLNSDTYVEYPSVFHGMERRIKVEGEVYLEVAHDSAKPFIVETYNTDIKVLGTKFNVSAYPSDVTISTTLLEGSVMVNDETILSPNEQLTINKHTSKGKLTNVDASQYKAWIDGIYRFDNMVLSDLALLFNRIYDVQVEIKSEQSMKKMFSGAIYRTMPFQEMFNTIMNTTKIEYTIEKEKIIIW